MFFVQGPEIGPGVFIPTFGIRGTDPVEGMQSQAGPLAGLVTPLRGQLEKCQLRPLAKSTEFVEFVTGRWSEKSQGDRSLLAKLH